MERPDWNSYFLQMADFVSRRSCDPSTQHGCVLVDSENRVLSTGYNGPVSGVPHDAVDFSRPNKYVWMCHAEQNALCFARCDLKGAIAYVTGEPCASCFRQLLQSGIRKIVHGPRKSACVSEYDRRACETMAKSVGAEVVRVDY